MIRVSRLCGLGIALCLTLFACPAWGQIGELQVDGTSYYRFAQPGQNTIRVIVLGGGKSGIYEIGEDVDLAELLALSGGPGGGGRSKTTLQLYRTENGRRELILEAKMEAFTERTEYPALQAGDVLRVRTVERQNFGWRDVLRIITATASVTFTIHRLVD